MSKKDGKISIKTYELLIDEIDLAVKNKGRKISKINDPDVRRLISKASSAVLISGVSLTAIIGSSAVISTGAANALGLSVAGAGTAGIIGGVGAAGTAGLIGGASAAGSAGIISGVGGVSFGSAAATGAAAGSLAGPAGIAIGAAAGLIVGGLVGLFAGKSVQRKNNQRMQAANQRVLSKQNTIIRTIKKEVEVLITKVELKDREIERLKYLLGVLEINNEIVESIA